MTINEVLDLVITEPNCGCWIWAGEWDAKGYGVYRHGSIKKPAHRLVYKSIRGEVPRYMHLDHLCLVKPCVNPDHLEIVTPKENFRRRREKGRSMRAVDIIDCQRELAEICQQHIKRIYAGLRTIDANCPAYDQRSLLILKDYLAAFDPIGFEFERISKSYANPENGTAIDRDEVRAMLRALSRLVAEAV